MVNAHYNGAAATVIEEFEALEAAVETFLALYETPSKVTVHIGNPERFGPFTRPIVTLNSARLSADYGTEQDAVHQAVEAHWDQWQQDEHPAMRQFVARVERRWLRTYPAPELQHKHFPARRWIIPELISEGLMLIAGKSGLGKSFWALQMGLAVAQGRKAFGQIDVEQGDVLYLSLEDDAQGMQERLEMCLEDGEALPAGLTIAHEAPLLSEGLYDRLDAWLRTHDSARLIIIDVLQKIRPPRRHKGDIYEQDYAIGEALKPLARRYHVAIVILHHNNKLVDPADPLDAISGSTGLIAPADIKAVFTRARGEADAKLFLTGRSVREQWVAFKFDEGLWTYLGDAQDVERSEARQDILALLRQAEGAMQAHAIAQRLGKNRNTVRVLLMKMVDKGEVKSPDPGYYALPLEPPTPPRESESSESTVNSVNSINSINTVNSVNRAQNLGTEPGETAACLRPVYGGINSGSVENINENGGAVYAVYGVYGVTDKHPPPPTPPTAPDVDGQASRNGAGQTAQRKARDKWPFGPAPTQGNGGG